MADKKVEEEFAGSAAGWFAGMFGQCWKEPSTEGDLKFDELDKKQKKEKKEKKLKKKKDDTTPEQEASAPAAKQGQARKTAAGTSRFLIDNSVLQIKGHPGIAFRSSKSDSDKVKSGPGPARWGETVEGIDEGDGWLRVGNFFLPMVYQGVPFVTPVVEKPAEETPVVEKSAEQAPVAEKPAEETPVVEKPTEETPVVQKPAEEMVAVQSAEKSAGQAAVAAEENKVLESPCDDADVCQRGTDVSSEPCNPVGQSENSVPTDEEAENHEEQPQAAWFAQPSVGTWLMAPPQAVVALQVTPLEVAQVAEPDAVFEPKTIVEMEPDCVLEPKILAEEPYEVSMTSPPSEEFVFEEVVKPAVEQQPQPEALQPTEWHHLPSVGTWSLRATPLKCISTP